MKGDTTMKKVLALVLSAALLLGITLPAHATTVIFDNAVAWSNTFNQIAELLASRGSNGEAVDLPIAGGMITFDENSITTGATGVQVVHGGTESPNQTVSYGTGSGLGENDNYWYFSLTYSAEASAATLHATGFAFLYASTQTGLPVDPTSDGALSLFGTLLDALFNSDNIAIKMGDVILVHKLLPGDRHLLAIDSLDYYNEFYYNDTDNFIVLE